MINSSSLGDRLNAYKNKKELPKSTDQRQILEIGSVAEALGFISGALLSILKIFVYGFTLKLIFSTDWSFIEFSIIGLALVFILNYIKKLIHKS